MLRGTPFHSRTAALCQAQNWRRWAGYLAAGSYELTHEREYYAIRSAVAMIDVSPLSKYEISGPDAMRLLDRIITRDVSRCRVGQVLYTTWCDEAGKVIDDGTLQRLDADRFRLTAAEPNLRWLHDNAWGLDADIQDISSAVAALALQGPAARTVLTQVTKADLKGLNYFHITQAEIQGIPALISRTGYTGDLGYEIWIKAGDGEVLWDALMAAGKPYGLIPAGMLALDLARVEAGLLLIEVDYVSARHALIQAQKSSPFQLGLGWTVDLAKGNFVGRRALQEEKERGPVWAFVGLEIHWESLEEIYAQAGLPPQLPSVAWRRSVPVFAGRRQVGYATSGCWSPILKKYVALAHVEADYGVPGTSIKMEVTVEHRPQRAVATVVRTPFFDPERKRD
jgi:aminomethyltransferase